MTEEAMRLWDIYETPEHEARACTVLYALLKERSEENDPHVNISHRKLPTMEEHRAFVERHPYAVWYLIELPGGEYVGYISVTHRNEIGIVLFARHRGKGYGRQALNLFLARHRPLPAIPSERSGEFLANINPANARSIALFTGAGFNLRQVTYALEEK